MTDVEPSQRTAARKLELAHALRVTQHLVTRELMIRYRRTRFGIAWGVIQPMVRFAAMGFVFGSVARLDIHRFFEFLFIGILVWTWFASGVTGATSSILDRAELTRRPQLPRMIVPLVAVITALIDMLMAFPILLVVLILTSGVPWVVVAVPYLIVVQGVLIAGVGLLCSASNVYFRDTKPIVETAMMIGFYATPIVYSLDLAPSGARTILGLNPMAGIVNSYRSLLLDGRMISLWTGVWTLAVSALILAAGISVFRRASPNFLDEL